MSLIAALLMPFAILLQRLGTFGTCTQGAQGPFMTGVWLSSPLLLVASVLMVWIWWQRHSTRGLFAFVCNIVGLVLVLGLSVWSVTLNASIWHETLFVGGSPCGPDHASAVKDGNRQIGARLIGIVYGPWPAAIALMSLLNLVADIRRGASAH